MHMYYHVLALCCLVEFSATTISDLNGSLHAQLHQLRYIVSEQGRSIKHLQETVNTLTKRIENCADQHCTAGDASTHMVRSSYVMFFQVRSSKSIDRAPKKT